MIMQRVVEYVVARADFQSHGEVRWQRNDGAVYVAVNNLWVALDELEYLLALLRKGGNCAHVHLLVKLYYIGFATLTDQIADLINVALDLGYPDRDVKWETLKQNKHVRASGIPTVVTARAKVLQIRRYIQVRNNIVHRNKLEDVELEELAERERDLMINAQLFFEGMGESTPHAYFERRAEQTGLREAILEVATARANTFEEHLRGTKLLLDEIAAKLVAQLAQTE